jgi:hypothetical protein
MAALTAEIICRTVFWPPARQSTRQKSSPPSATKRSQGSRSGHPLSPGIEQLAANPMIRLLIEARDPETGEPRPNRAGNEAAGHFHGGPRNHGQRSLAWYSLSQSPEVEDRRAAELPECWRNRLWTMLAELTHTRAVFDKRRGYSPRPHAGAPELRETIRGRRIPAGSLVRRGRAMAAHRHCKFWESPTTTFLSDFAENAHQSGTPTCRSALTPHLRRAAFGLTEAVLCIATSPGAPGSASPRVPSSPRCRLTCARATICGWWSSAKPDRLAARKAGTRLLTTSLRHIADVTPDLAGEVMNPPQPLRREKPPRADRPARHATGEIRSRPGRRAGPIARRIRL